MAPRERALVIFVGLMRAFERAFPAFRHTLITPNEQSFDFEIAVATSLTQTCSDKDRKSGCCRADASAYKYVNRTGDELLRRIRTTYAPYLRHGEIGVDIFVTPAPSSHPGSQPQRLRPLLARPQYNLRHFGVVILARPDAAVVRSNSPLDLFRLRPAALATEVTGRTKKCTIRPCTSHRSLLPRIDLRKECASRPGLSIVAGGHHGNGGTGLSRDSDYLYLACTPAALLRYFYAVAPGQTSCMCGGGGAACDRVDRNDTAEPLTSCATNIGGLPCERLLPNCIDENKTRAALVPADFKALQMDPNKLSCRSVWCPTLAQFRRDGYRLGTVDRAGLWSGIVRDIFDPPVGHCRRPRTGEKSAERLGHFHGVPFRGFAELRHGRGGSVPWKPATRKKSVLVPGRLTRRPRDADGPQGSASGHRGTSTGSWLLQKLHAVAASIGATLTATE